MRTDFSPTGEAARRLVTRDPPTKAGPDSVQTAAVRWCEWPRRSAAAAPRVSIWQALREIQTRHA